LRIQRRQAEVARFARELFELKAEIIATKFDWPLLSRMTGIELPSQQQKETVQGLMAQVQQAQQAGQEIPPQILAQADGAQKMMSTPSQEEVMQLLQDDISRNYRVDIESDSTIRNDLTRNQQTMNLFLQGTAQFGQAMGPIIMADASMKPMVMEIYGAFARQFKLGRQAEDAIDAATEQAEETAKQPPQPDPKLELDKQKLGLDKEKMDAELQMKQEELKLKAQEIQMKATAEEQKNAHDAKLKEIELRHDMQIKQEEAGKKAQIAEQEAGQKAQMAQAAHEADMQAREQKAADEVVMRQAEFARSQHEAAVKFEQEQERAALAFQKEQERKEKIAARESESRIKVEGGLMKEKSQREASEPKQPAQPAKPKKVRLKVVRDKDGKLAGAEIDG
jgi:hypothetical protein